MTDFFGTNGALSFLMNPMSLLFAALFVLGAFITRKAVNDQMGQGFSVIAAGAGGFIGYVIMDNIFHTLKFSVGVGFIVWAAAGLLVGDLLGDGQSGGGN
jgi:hypothetical protein